MTVMTGDECSSRKTLLIVDPLFYMEGGGGAVTAWSIEALRTDFDVHVLAWNTFDTAACNRRFGTSLAADDIRLIRPPKAIRRVWDLVSAIDPDPYSMQRWALLMRCARTLCRRRDLTISTFGEIDVGCPCLQYVHYPYLGAARGGETPRRADRWVDRFHPWRVVSGFSHVRAGRNRTLVNSGWTGGEFRRFYGEEARVDVLYPPVPGAFPHNAWKHREQGFVCVGRINSDKNLDLLIDIVARLRELDPAFHLHLVGTPTPAEPGADAYYRRIRRRIEESPQWLFLEESISREQLVSLLVTHRFGIHGKTEEHFGIAVAEMVKAGCIVFAPSNGGPVEILADDRLLFESADSAVHRIQYVVENPVVQEELRRHLTRQADRFSAERFVGGVRAHVEAALDV